MKKLITLFSFVLSFAATSVSAQIFWNENFETGAATGLQVSSYVSSNGAWTLTTSISTSEGTNPNRWYVSCQEAGHIAAGCGSTCTTLPNLGATLHIGAGILGDMGASYDAGSGIGNVTTDRRAESPTINCTGHTGIILRFYYIENGQTSIDDGTVWYSVDNGATWLMLVNTVKTTLCGGQGLWAQYSMALPATADNNPGVKIGFRWVNNNDLTGTDPSFAIDSVTMSAPVTAPVATFTTTATTACQDSCITFTNTTTGTLDSVRWRTIPTTSVVIASPTSTTSTGICFHAAGTYSVTLTAYNSAGSNTSTHVITVNPTPHPVIIKSGHTLSVSGTYLSYQWIQNITPITGATTNTYTYSAAAAYSVLVDSGGCRGFGILSTLGISGMNNNNDNYWLTHTDNDLNLFTTETLNESMNVTVFDATGRKILNDIWNAGSKVKQINSGFFPPGLYIIRLSNSNTSAVLRFIK